MSDHYLDTRQRLKSRHPQEYEAAAAHHRQAAASSGRQQPQQHQHQQQQQQHHRPLTQVDMSGHRTGSSKRSGRRDKGHANEELLVAAASPSEGMGMATHHISSSMAPTTGQFRSGHIEVDSLYAAGQSASGSLVVNSMNAPNNSTMQCGCENIDCPFCNLMTSVQMKESF